MFNFSGRVLPLNLGVGQQFEHLAFATLRRVPEFPIAESDTIVFGQISKSDVFLSKNKRALYTEYTFKIEGALRPKSIAAGAEIAVGRLGGIARLESGGILRYNLQGFGPEPVVGSRYLMFLQHVLPPADAYSIIKFWNIVDGVVTAAFEDDVVRAERAQSVMNRRDLREVISIIEAGPEYRGM